MSLPVVRLAGTPHQQGLQHGEALRDRIAENVAVYLERLRQELGLERGEALARARRYGGAVERQSPAYWDGVRGVAAGSGLSLDEIALLNVRYEILYHQYSANAGAGPRPGSILAEGDGCTSFAVAPTATADGHLVMGQNWDWIPEVRGAVLHTVEEDGLETLGFTQAGIVGTKIGMSSEGIGIGVNGLLTTSDDWSRLRKPFHVRCYEMLRSRSFDAAVAIATGESRSCSTNWVVAQAPDRLVDIEAAPEQVRLLECEAGCLAHANHFVQPDALGIVEPPNPRRAYSYCRHDRMGELLREGVPLTAEAIRERLKDHDGHPNGICRHLDMELPAEQRTITVTSVVMDLTARRMWITDRQPCENPYQTLSLG